METVSFHAPVRDCGTVTLRYPLLGLLAYMRIVSPNPFLLLQYPSLHPFMRSAMLQLFASATAPSHLKRTKNVATSPMMPPFARSTRELNAVSPSTCCGKYRHVCSFVVNGVIGAATSSTEKLGLYALNVASSVVLHDFE